jgi:hypothetical protein
MNGVLLFGWSTAVIFKVLRNAMRIRDTANREQLECEASRPCVSG